MSRREYQRVNSYKSFGSWKDASILPLALARGKKKDFTCVKFKKNTSPTKKPLSVFQVLTAVQHFLTKLIRNANKLFDLLFPWPFICTQTQIYTNSQTRTIKIRLY